MQNTSHALTTSAGRELTGTPPLLSRVACALGEGSGGTEAGAGSEGMGTGAVMSNEV
jgi:hypothetical protein